MACEAFCASFLHNSHPYLPERFRWADCQLKYLAYCDPPDIRRALDTLPATLDETYERTLRAIKKWKYARRLFLCVAVASRPLRVEELADILAFDFESGQTPKFNKKWRQQDPLEAVLLTCSTLLTLVDVGGSQIIQFSHFSVKEFLTSTRLGDKRDTISCRYHVSLTPAHTFFAQVCLGILLHLDQNITRDNLKTFPLAEYAAEYWVEHAHFEGVSGNVEEAMKQLFDPSKPHLAIWVWICDPCHPKMLWKLFRRVQSPPPPRRSPLQYATFCGLPSVVNSLAIAHPEDVHSRAPRDKQTPLHLASSRGYVEVAGLLVKHGADATAKDNEGSTPLHLAVREGNVNLARLLVGHGADATAQDNEGSTALHLAARQGSVDLIRLLVEYGAYVRALDIERSTALHLAVRQGSVNLARFLVEHGADVTASHNEGSTVLHLATRQ